MSCYSHHLYNQLLWIFKAYDDMPAMSQKSTAKAVGLSLEDLEKAISADIPGALPGPTLVSPLVASSASHQPRRPHSPRRVSLKRVLQVQAWCYIYIPIYYVLILHKTGDISAVCGNWDIYVLTAISSTNQWSCMMMFTCKSARARGVCYLLLFLSCLAYNLSVVWLLKTFFLVYTSSKATLRTWMITVWQACNKYDFKVSERNEMLLSSDSKTCAANQIVWHGWKLSWILTSQWRHEISQLVKSTTRW